MTKHLDPRNLKSSQLGKILIILVFLSATQMRFEIPIIGLIVALLTSFLFFGLSYKYIGLIWGIRRDSRVIGWVVIIISSIHHIFACGLGVIRLVPKYENIVWGIDNRMFLSRAYKYLQFGIQNDSLSYIGFDYKYHAMPSYLAAQLSHNLKVPIDATLFLILPFLVYITIFIVLFEIATFYGLTRLDSGIVATFICSINYQNSISEITKLKKPLISSDIMLNTQIGIAAIICAIYLSIIAWKKSYTWSILLGISLSALKPQFIPFFWLIAITIYFFDSKKRSMKFTVFHFVGLLVSLIVQKLYNFGNIQAEYSLSIVSPNLYEYFKSISIILLIWIGLFVVKKTSKLRIGTKFNFIFLGYLLLKLLFDSLFFNVAGLTKFSLIKYLGVKENGDSDFNQGFILLFLAVLIAVAINIINNLYLELRNFKRVILAFCLLSVMVIRLVVFIPELAKPDIYGKEVVNLDSLSQVFRSISMKNPKFLVNDISDPTENYRRYGSGMYWSSLGTGQFYLSDIATGHFLAKDIGLRLANASKFFDSNLSSWHYSFLKSNEIDYVILNTRCQPEWINQVNFSLKNQYFVLIPKTAFKNFLSKEFVNQTPQRKRYGASVCL